MVVGEPPLPSEPGDPQEAGHRALARRQDGTDQQQLGVAPRPLLQEHRREGSDEGGEAGWQTWHGGVSRRGCASLSLPRAPPASRPRPPLGRPPNLPPNGQSRAHILGEKSLFSWQLCPLVGCKRPSVVVAGIRKCNVMQIFTIKIAFSK